MSRASSTPTSATSRRKARAAIAAATPTLAEPDPIFATIDTRKQTYARYCEAHTRWCDNGEGPGTLEEQSDEACKADNEALIAVLSTRPTTIAGALALLEYVRACDDERDAEILTVLDPADDRMVEGFGYHTLLATLIDALRPLAA
jgi:hypothetical protein